MKKSVRLVTWACVLVLLSACNLPYAVPPTSTGPAPAATATSFAVATLPGAPTTTPPSINVITITPGTQPSATPTVTPLATASPTQATAIPVSVYPDTPEGVIEAFVEAYPDDTNAMLSYLSASLRSSLPAGGPGALLNVQGDINGMLFLSGSSVPNPPQATFQVALQVGTEQVLRTFSLGQENGHWIITAISG